MKTSFLNGRNISKALYKPFKLSSRVIQFSCIYVLTYSYLKDKQQQLRGTINHQLVIPQILLIQYYYMYICITQL